MHICWVKQIATAALLFLKGSGECHLQAIIENTNMSDHNLTWASMETEIGIWQHYHSNGKRENELPKSSFNLGHFVHFR